MMDKKKQIEEMAKLTKQHCTIDNMCGSCSLETCNDCLSEVLYNADYRKASEVAREIFEEIDNLLLFTIGVIDESLDSAVQENNFIVANLMSNNRSLVDTLRVAISVRKKKYTEEEG